jgi:hypothetical protein
VRRTPEWQGTGKMVHEVYSKERRKRHVNMEKFVKRKKCYEHKKMLQKNKTTQAFAATATA